MVCVFCAESASIVSASTPEICAVQKLSKPSRLGIRHLLDLPLECISGTHRSYEGSDPHLHPPDSCSATHCRAAALAASRFGAFKPLVLRSIAESTDATEVTRNPSRFTLSSIRALKVSMSFANASCQPPVLSKAG